VQCRLESAWITLQPGCGPRLAAQQVGRRRTIDGGVASEFTRRVRGVCTRGSQAPGCASARRAGASNPANGSSSTASAAGNCRSASQARVAWATDRHNSSGRVAGDNASVSIVAIGKAHCASSCEANPDVSESLGVAS
jgi:hypothetical protein